MNKENAHLYLPLVQALVDGKIIQTHYENEWLDMNEVEFESFDEPEDFRIKPEPRTFEMWLSPSSGAMFPIATFPNDQPDMERITVREVLK